MENSSKRFWTLEKSVHILVIIAIDHKLYFNEFSMERVKFCCADSRGQLNFLLKCKRREGCKLLHLTLSDSVENIQHLSDAR
jgi:hypothetical protein